MRMQDNLRRGRASSNLFFFVATTLLYILYDSSDVSSVWLAPYGIALCGVNRVQIIVNENLQAIVAFMFTLEQQKN